MDISHFCEKEGCIAPAHCLCFKADKQRKVCTAHMPTGEQKLFFLEQIHFITSPEDEDTYLQRLQESKRGREHLSEIKTKVDEEVIVALEALETVRSRAVQVVNETYEAETTRTKQHFHQVEVLLENFSLELSLYLYAKEHSISGSMKSIVNEEDDIPCILRARVFNNQLELARVIMKSCSRGKLPLNKHLTSLFNQLTRNIITAQLFQHAQKSAATDDFLELQKALADCEESLTLRMVDEAARLKVRSEERLEKKNEEREGEMVLTSTQDATSYSHYFNFI